MLARFCTVLMALVLVACSGPMDTRIDGSSQEAYEKSLKTIKAKLTSEETIRFEEALQVVVFSEVMPKEGGLLGMMAALKDTEKLQAKVLETVNGKTPRELIALADAKIKERAQAELKSVTSEIAELERRKAGAEKSKELLSKIVVADPKFYWAGDYFGKPIVDFKVTNSTGMPLSRLFFHGVVSTPGRAIPWIDEDFNYEVPGGLEPGESKHLHLAPNRFSKWGTAETEGRKDLVLTVTVTNAEDANKKEIADEFGKKDDDRLQKLLVMKVELEQKLRR